jgi:RNA polymerase sigma factor (TIGR02999 family)
MMFGVMLKRAQLTHRKFLQVEAIGPLTHAADQGDAKARARLFETLYSELHRMAQRQLMRHGGGLTLGSTTLLHETYLDLSRAGGPVFPDKARFMAYAARAMRGLIIDNARRGQALKRGGQFEFTQVNTRISDEVACERADADQLQAISDALEKLTSLDANLSELVDLKFFGGLGFEEIAALRDVSERTVQRDWAKARALLHRYLSDEQLQTAAKP